jgi:DNA polymerase III alpha subunit
MLAEIPGILQLKRRKSGMEMDLQSTEIAAACGLAMTCNQGVPRNDIFVQTDPPSREGLLAERELLSLDLSAHPLDFCNLGEGFTRISDLPSLATGQTIKIAGSVIRYQTPPTRTGRRVVYIILEDGSGVADVTVFSDVQEKCGGVLFRCGWMEVRGKIQRRGPKSLSIIASEVKALKTAKGK